MLIQFLAITAASCCACVGHSDLAQRSIWPTTHSASTGLEKLIKKFKVVHVDAGVVYKKIVLKDVKDVDYLSLDPTDNSIVARGTASGLVTLADLIAKLDKVNP
jgi:hypothetical protein